MSLGHFGNNGREYLRKRNYKEITDEIHRLKYATLEPNKRLIQKLQQKLDKMTEEDIKYRQGRSRNQLNSTYKVIEVMACIVAVVAVAFIGYCIYGLLNL
jgi:hypothetical protein